MLVVCVELCPLKICVEVLPLLPVGMTLFRNGVFADGTQLDEVMLE